MNDSGVESIRMHDLDGQLIAAGITWIEYSEFKMLLVCIPAMALAMPLLILGPWMLGTLFALKWTTLFAGNFFLLVLVIWIGLPLVHRERSLIFHADGKIAVPDGLPVQKWIKEMSFPHTEVTSLECVQAGQLFEGTSASFINIFGREGDQVTVGHKVHPQVCHKAVVQLTKALAEIRQAIARPEQRFEFRDTSNAAHSAVAGARPDQRTNTVID